MSPPLAGVRGVIGLDISRSRPLHSSYKSQLAIVVSTLALSAYRDRCYSQQWLRYCSALTNHTRPQSRGITTPAPLAILETENDY